MLGLIGAMSHTNYNSGGSLCLQDMYDKMMLIDKSAPTEEEHRLKAVTKPR